MLVKDWMNTTPVTINAHDTVKDAMNLILKDEIHLLPVLENDLLVGVVTDKSFKKAFVPGLGIQFAYNLDDEFWKVKVRDIMTTELVSIPLDYTIQEAAEVFLVNDIPGAPIFNNKKEMLGLLTKEDIFKAIILFTETGNKGIRFAVDQVNYSGCIEEITDLVRAHGGRVNSVMASANRSVRGHIRIYVTGYDIDTPSLNNLKKVLEEKSTLLYVLDLDRNERIIY